MPFDYYGETLEELTIHYLDQDSFVPVWAPEDVDPTYGWCDWFYNCGATLYPWYRDNAFPILTHLTIAATSRTHAYFRSFTSSVPALRELTLVAHNRDGLDMYWGSEDGLWPVERLEHLERITLSGDDFMVLAMLSTFAANFSTLLYLTIYTPHTSSHSTGATTAHYISRCPRLKGLALLTPHRDNILSTLAVMHTQDIDDDHVNVRHDDLEMLVLEGDDLSWLSEVSTLV